ncbi:MAG: hypothetical protein KF886_01815 [Candidatus Hydrogenedentes bacterium]|nr:hypothetical protein [Candidatus Hydrogenedentota bacterium]
MRVNQIQQSLALFASALLLATTAAAQLLPDVAPLDWEGDLATRMVDGLHADLDRRIDAAREDRSARWSASPLTGAFAAENRADLRTILGAVDARVRGDVETIAAPGEEGPLARGEGYHIYAVRWPVFGNAWGEGLLVEPDEPARASLILLPDADENPEALLGLEGGGNPYALRLAAAGARILIPVLADRTDTWSGHPDVRMTNQPHREWIYRGAYEMGRHVIGFELQKALAGADWLVRRGPGLPLGVMGYGEGGLLALHAAALDTRIGAAVVSGYFGPREGLWAEPIYRNVWGLLSDFGDAELAALVAPRALIIEPAAPPAVSGPPMTEGRPHGAAPGAVPAPPIDAIQAEVARAESYVANKPDAPWIRIAGQAGREAGQDETLQQFAKTLELTQPSSAAPPEPLRELPDARVRMKRQVEGMLDWVDRILEEAPHTRATFWSNADAASAATWVASTAEYRRIFHEEIIGSLPESTIPLNPRTRQVYETDHYTGHEVVLDVYEDVFAYGILLLPKGIKPGERRPVVVCQHGLEGRPQEITDPAINSHYYVQYGCKLAEEGFIVYAPQNPYIGGDHFRSVQRKANPLRLSLFSYIIEQHRQTLKWLGGLPFVDPDRIAFYGLSYGGKTAMRVPAVLEEYCLSICSGDFNEWIWKNVTRRRITSYMFHGEYEMFEWNLGETFNYAEMAWLICPRPFMVERGHWDGVAPDEWVGYEFARVRNRYDLLGLTDETAIEWFNGPHKINGVGTFQFLRDKLNFARTP